MIYFYILKGKNNYKLVAKQIVCNSFQVNVDCSIKSAVIINFDFIINQQKVGILYVVLLIRYDFYRNALLCFHKLNKGILSAIKSVIFIIIIRIKLTRESLNLQIFILRNVKGILLWLNQISIFWFLQLIYYKFVILVIYASYINLF